MASNFLACLEKTLGHEGGYSFDPTDLGGETYKGISRRHWPAWIGWYTVDQWKKSGKVGDLWTLLPIRTAVSSFYRENFWGRIAGDELPDNDVAAEMFDSAVNCGVSRAVQFLQKALNRANRNQAAWPDLAEDGDMGAKTLATLKTALTRDKVLLLNLMNAAQVVHYWNLITAAPAQEKWVGWWSRIEWRK